MKARGVVGLILGVAVIVGTTAAWAETWPMYQGNAAHTGYVPATLNPAQFALRWQRNVGGSMDLNPVTAADGKVFVSQYGYFSNAGLYTLSAATGNTLWSVNYGNVFSVNPPSYAFGNVYIQTGNHASDTYLRAYGADNGQFVFRTAHAAQWERYYSPTIYGDKVYVDGGYYGGMYAFDAHVGTQNWYQGLPQYDQWTPAVDANYAYSYVGDYTPALYVFNRMTGQPAYQIPDPDFQWNGWSMNQAPVLGAQQDALAIHDGRLISFNLQTHTIGWQQRRNFTGQPSLADGVIYAIDSGALTARDEATGDLLWGWEVPSDSLIDTLIVTDSHVFARTASAVYAVDLQTHTSAWSYPASGHLALSEGVLYIAGTAGDLTAIEVPEPAGAWLVVLGTLVVTARRRQ